MKRNYIYSLLAVAAMALIAILFFYPDDIDGRVLQQADIQQGLANGQEGKAFHEATGETTRWTNSLLSGMPNFQIAPSYSSASWLNVIAKAYSLWLPSPANLLFIMMLGFFIMGLCMKMRWYVAVLGALAWGFSTYFIIIIGAGHIWKFVTLAYIPPTIGGIVLCYRGKRLAGLALSSLFGALQLLSNHPQMSYYFMFVIAAMMIAYLITAIKQHDVKGWLISTAVVICAGVLAVFANCASLYNTAQYSKETIRGKATEIVTDDAPQAAQGADFDYITAWSYGGDETLTLLVPNAKGGASLKPQGGVNYPKTVAELPSIDKKIEEGTLFPEERDALGQFTQYFGEQPMTNGPVYVGAFILMLAVLGICVSKGPMRWCLLGVTILTLLLALGYNLEGLSRWFVDHFPGYNKFRTVSSILVVAEFTIPVLAMMALQRIVSLSPEERSSLLRPLYVTAGIFAAVCIIMWLFPSVMGDGLNHIERESFEEQGLFGMPEYFAIIQAIRDARLAMVSADALRSLMIIAVGTAILAFYLKGMIKQPWVMVSALIALTLIDLFFVNKRYIDSDSFVNPVATEETFRMTDADREILADTAMNYRVMDIDDMGGARSSYFHKTIGGYHAAKLTRYNDLLTHAFDAKANAEINEWLNYRLNQRLMPDSLLTDSTEKHLPGVINMLNTKYLLYSVDNYGRLVEVNPDALGNAWFVKEIKYAESPNDEMSELKTLNPAVTAVADNKFEKILGQPGALDTDSKIVETSYAPNRLSYHSDSKTGGIAVFSEIYFPWGWTATIDGKPAEIARVNYVLRALKVPAGSHSIEFVFEPESLEVTNTMSVIAVIIIYLIGGTAIFMAWRRKRHPADKKPTDKKPGDTQ